LTLKCILYTKPLSRQKWCQMARARTEYPVYLIKVYKERCNGCGQCLDLCPVDVFEFLGGIALPSRPENCLGCGTCEAVCERKAIVVTEI